MITVSNQNTYFQTIISNRLELLSRKNNPLEGGVKVIKKDLENKQLIIKASCNEMEDIIVNMLHTLFCIDYEDILID